MARQRDIRPEFFRDKRMGKLGSQVATVYEALWCWADDGGAVRIEPDVLKGECFIRWPEYTPAILTDCLVSLHAAGRISPYAVGDELYALIPTLDKHSKINRPSKFRYPREGHKVDDIRAWLSGQYTHGALTEHSAPVLPIASRLSPPANSPSPLAFKDDRSRDNGNGKLQPEPPKPRQVHPAVLAKMQASRSSERAP